MILLSLSDPRVAQIPVVDTGEPLVALDGLSARLRMDHSTEHRANLGYDLDFRARETVGVKLAKASLQLPDGYALLVKESLRPSTLQDKWFREYLQGVLTRHPGIAEDDANAMASQYVAPPSVAGHPTGGAIDVTLCDGDGRELDLGCPYDADDASSNGACRSACDTLEPQAAAHRRILFSVLEEAGFVNYPFEWWHWSYGDRYWAAVMRRERAIYGAVDMR
ncbi:D-alanyl-D-alanine dipeptidase [Burkholderia sp. Bp9002]|nr:D-alanyl-D-alanine dipeptidase [Burkholderia sp. Bp9125]RQS13824.1 D-alanyl-D-alanine dipeptidase [Burkholderia sp. Bp9002]